MFFSMSVALISVKPQLVSGPSVFLPCLNLISHNPEAPGVADFYDVIYRHWGQSLRELQVARAEKAKEKGTAGEAVVIEIPDDDGDLASLESHSLEQAKKGIVIEGVVCLDGPEPPAEPPATVEKKPEETGEVGHVEAGAEVVPASGRGSFRMTIDHVLNPPNLPPLKYPTKPASMELKSVNDINARMEQLKKLILNSHLSVVPSKFIFHSGKTH